MKTRLLLALLALPLFGFAQSQITGFYGYINDDFGTTDGTGRRSYLVVTPNSPLDQSESGANVVWNFDQLTVDGTSSYHNAAPTGSEISTYPGTNRVVTNTRVIGPATTISKVFFNTWATTGISNADFQVAYTDNAVLTNTTLDYGNTFVDPVAGTFTYDIYSGTFTGSNTTTVDAYGTLNTDDVYGTTSDAVTRMKIVQSLSLSSPPFGVVGTAVFTTYHYYRENDLYPFFTSATSDFNIPLLSIDEEITAYEMANPALLGVSSQAQHAIAIGPNPVHGVLTIDAEPTLTLEFITVVDANGRIIKKVDPSARQIDFSSLQSGIYFVQIDSSNGSTTKKVIKQ